jgi:hypothetical protein
VVEEAVKAVESPPQREIEQKPNNLQS